MFVTLVTLRFCSLLRATSLLVRSLSSLLRFAAVNFHRKLSIFSGKVAKKNSAKYKPPGNLIEDRRQRSS